jgi:Domain of unknown function (DUF4748)
MQMDASMTPAVHCFSSSAFIISAGLYAFVLAKRSVDENRVEMMRSKQRVLEARQRDVIEKFGGAAAATTAEK